RNDTGFRYSKVRDRKRSFRSPVAGFCDCDRSASEAHGRGGDTCGGMKSPGPFFERFFDIRKQELGRLLLTSTYLLLIIASYSTSKAVRDSLFVTKIGPSQLPYMYLLIAGAMGLVSLVYSGAVNRIGLHRLIR